MARTVVRVIGGPPFDGSATEDIYVPEDATFNVNDIGTVAIGFGAHKEKNGAWKFTKVLTIPAWRLVSAETVFEQVPDAT